MEDIQVKSGAFSDLDCASEVDNQIPREERSCEAGLSENEKESDTEFEDENEQQLEQNILPVALK